MHATNRPRANTVQSANPSIGRKEQIQNKCRRTDRHCLGSEATCRIPAHDDHGTVIACNPKETVKKFFAIKSKIIGFPIIKRKNLLIFVY
jgi:hypothetical protein